MDPWDVPLWALLIVPILLGLAAFLIGFALGGL